MSCRCCCCLEPAELQPSPEAAQSLQRSEHAELEPTEVEPAEVEPARASEPAEVAPSALRAYSEPAELREPAELQPSPEAALSLQRSCSCSTCRRDMPCGQSVHFFFGEGG
jgi:hypothetical protein